MILFNDRRDGRFVSVLYDIHKGWQDVFSLPASAVSHDGKTALGLNFHDWLICDWIVLRGFG